MRPQEYNIDTAQDIATQTHAYDAQSIVSQFSATTLRSQFGTAAALTIGTRANKATTLGSIANDLYLESDTGFTYRWTGAAWAFAWGIGRGAAAAFGAIVVTSVDNGAEYFVTDTGLWWHVAGGVWVQKSVTAKAILTTSGPTTLTVGAIADGQTVVRSGATLVGSSGLTPALSVVTKTTAYTVTDADDVILVDASGGAVTITLHAVATAKKKKYDIKKIDSSANAVTIEGNLAETIDGALNVSTTTQYASYTVVPDGTAWYIV